MNDMPWIKSYPAGVRWDADIIPAPLQTILDNTVAKWPDRPAIDFMGKRLSYRELGDYVNRAACGLQQLGVKPGVHVGLYLPNILRGAEGRRHGGQLLATRCRSGS